LIARRSSSAFPAKAEQVGQVVGGVELRVGKRGDDRDRVRSLASLNDVIAQFAVRDFIREGGVGLFVDPFRPPRFGPGNQVIVVA
jgi:hypothetical protein